ncbi:MAG: NAD(P)H-hydrate dehydratase, partial [Thermoplasmata archaeon]|nr:NAD(P)H-hydrate dehydratase [Thermoplasmata archaeon]
LRFEEVAVLDKNSEALGIPTSKLMENAGTALAEVIIEQFNLKKSSIKILMFCGLGNNGGDGFVAARKLAERTSSKIEVILMGAPSDIKTELSRANFNKLKHHKSLQIVPLIEDLTKLKKAIESSDLIIDAMLGVGISGKLRDPYKRYVNAINTHAAKSKLTVIAVDAPTGLGTRDAVKPNVTVTFHDVKVGMTKRNSGEIIIKDIGIPPEASQFTGPGDLIVYYPRSMPHYHKGDNGRLLIVGGGPFTGAPALAGLAAYRTGIDLVRIATPKNTYPIIASYSPNFIVHPLSENYLQPKDVNPILKMITEVDCVIIGPGLGDHRSTKSAVRSIINKSSKPFVIDADAIKAVGENISTLKSNKNAAGVITPHSSEFRILSKEKLPEDLAKKSEMVRHYAKQLNLTIILKGAIDIISDGKNLKLNRTGNPGMTVGGTGDVLAGVVGALIAKGLEPYEAARVGAFVNGYSGDLAFQAHGYSMVATDLIEEISKVLKKYID